MTKVILSLVILVAAALHTVSGLRSGAPLQACISLTPSHGGNAAQAGQSPHIVDLTDFDSMFNESSNTTTLYYTPNTLYSITLVATGIGLFSDVFRGFLLQGRAYADDSVVGTFQAPPANALYRLSSCQRSDGSVTHNSNAGKTNITVYWMSPASGTGTIYFGFAFVWRFATFWADLQTAPLMEAEINEPPVTTQITPTIIMTTAAVAVTPTPPVVINTPPVVVATPPGDIVGEITTPPVMIPAATPTQATGPGDEITGGAAGLTVGTIMISLAAILTIFTNAIY